MSIYADRVNQPVTTPGTGPLTLGSTPTAGYQTFLSAFGTGTTTVAYCIADQSGTNWEVGSGSYNGTTNVLTRPATPLSSSNAGAIVNFNTGTQDVFCDAPAAYLDVFTTSRQGTVPASGGGTTNFLRADGVFAAPPVTAPAVSTASVTSPLAWNSSACAQYALTALANALTINADANAAPVDGQKMMFCIKDNGTARALTWTTGSAKSFRVIGTTLPTTTVVSKIVYVGCIYNAADSRWDVVAVGQEV